MSKSTHNIKQQQQQMMLDETASVVAEMFDLFCGATTMRQILGLYRNICDSLNLRPGPLNEFYPKLKSKIRSWKAQALWKKFDTRATHRVYCKGTACTGSRVLVIGAGPCGLRTAIEAQLMGAKVVVVEKRDRISRNNVVHLWPFVITDLRNLGAKKFYGKFCAGSIDHISIRQLQCILLKVALLLGVEIHEGVSFINIIEPSDGLGWRAEVSPEDHAVSHYEFDVLIGADGKRNTLEGFKRKEFRGKLAIAITANFINKKTEAEARAEEISGVAFIFNQSFFKELYQTTGIDLENIVYYKDETHYFVMTAKKHSLIDKGVIMQDFIDPAELLASSNVNTDKLLDYAREAAEFSTKYQMPNLEFAVNHYGKPDVAMFDFTSMFASETSSRVIVRKNYRLLQCLVGDSLLEPFWPTGSGCARGFLSSMDSAYMIKLWANPRNSILGVLAQRESIYRLLAQTTPENLQRDIGAYTVDPASRYPNLNKSIVTVCQVKHLIDTDDINLLEQTHMDANVFAIPPVETPMRRKRRTGDTLPLSAVILRWIKAQLHSHEFMQSITEVSECVTSGKVLCALINRYRPDLIDLNAIKDLTPIESNELAFKILEADLSIPRVINAKDSINLENTDSKIWLNYLEQICEVFRGEIPHVKHPKLDVFELRDKSAKDKQSDFSRLLNRNAKKAKSPMQDIDLTAGVHRRSILDEEKVRRQRKYGNDSPGQMDTSRRAKKRRSQEKPSNIEERQERLQDIEANRLERQSKRKQQRYQQTLNFYKSLHMLQAGQLLREGLEQRPFEDYSIYMYRQNAPEFNERVKELENKILYPDRERGIQSTFPRAGNDGNFSDRIKSMEQQITSKNVGVTDKKPKDLLRAIGKIDSSDWQVREIEKKMQQSKKTEISGKSREKVPKWSKEQFLARQNKMSKAQNEQDEDERFKEIDETLKNLDKQLKDGSLLEIGQRGKNKVASIAGQFGKKEESSDDKASAPITKHPKSKVNLLFNKQTAFEKCHFCKQTVYLMEKISTEGLTLHRSCLKCYHCHTNLRLGGYAFDRDDPNGRFYCTQHFKLPAKAVRPIVRKSKPKKQLIADNLTLDKDDLLRGRPESVVQLDLLDRGQTPERIEFENTDAMSDGEPSLENIMDENEWTDRNFISDAGESESDLSSSDESDEDSESFEDPDEGSPIAQTLQLATDWIGKQKYTNDSDDSDIDFYDSSEGMLDDDDADSQTEGEEFKKAREMRRQEVKLLPLPANLPTDTETEVVSNADNELNIDSKNLIENSNESNINNNNNNNTSDNNNNNNNNNSHISDEKKDNNNANNKDIDTIKCNSKSEDLIFDFNEKRDSTQIDNIFNNNDNNTTNSNNSLEIVNVNKIKEDNDKLINEAESDIIIGIGNLPENIKNFLKNSPELKNTEVYSSESPKTVKESNDSSIALRNALKILERDIGSKLSPEIDSLNEKLFQLNNIVKLNKDVENLEKENLVKNDIKKKLSLKEKWLSDFNANVALMQNQKHKPEMKNIPTSDIIKLSKIDEIKIELAQATEPQKKNKEEAIKSKLDEIRKEIQEEKLKAAAEDKLKVLTKNNTKQKELEEDDVFHDCENDEKFDNDFENILEGIENPNVNQITNANVDEEEQSNDELLQTRSAENNEKNEKERYFDFQKLKKRFNNPKYDPEIGQLLYDIENRFSPPMERKMSNALKKIENQNFTDTRVAIASQISGPRMSKQASLDLSKFFPSQKTEKSTSKVAMQPQKNLKDIDLNKYFPQSPAPQRKSSITASVPFGGGLRKSQTEKTIPALYKPTIKEKIAQAAKSNDSSNEHLDITPSTKPKVKISCLQKPTAKEKLNMKLQESADKNNAKLSVKSQSPTKSNNSSNESLNNTSSPKAKLKISCLQKPTAKEKFVTKKLQQDVISQPNQESIKKFTPNALHYKPTMREIIGSTADESKSKEDFDIFHNQLDGDIDITEKKNLKKTNHVSKKNLEITTIKTDFKKSDNIKTTKATNAKQNSKNKQSNNPSIRNIKETTKNSNYEHEIFDEILNDGHVDRSPSLEYQKLFQEEKSPSEDLSDKIEAILEDSNIISKRSNKKKITAKALSLGESEFKRNQKELSEEGDLPKTFGGILQRYESFNSIKKINSNDKERENLNLSNSSIKKSTESLKSRNSFSSNPDELHDLEKTMEYLKSEWKHEASSFLQKKRTDFFSKTKEKIDNEWTTNKKEKISHKNESINSKREEKDLSNNKNDKNSIIEKTTNVGRRESLTRRLSDSIRQSLNSDLLGECDLDDVDVDQIFNEIVEELKTNSDITKGTPDVDNFLTLQEIFDSTKKVKDLSMEKESEKAADSDLKNSTKVSSPKANQKDKKVIQKAENSSKSQQLKNESIIDMKQYQSSNTKKDLNNSCVNQEKSSKLEFLTDTTIKEQTKIMDDKEKITSVNETRSRIQNENILPQIKSENQLPKLATSLTPPSPPPPPPLPSVNKDKDDSSVNKKLPKGKPLADIIRSTAGKISTNMLRKVPVPESKPIKYLFENDPFSSETICKDFNKKLVTIKNVDEKGKIESKVNEKEPVEGISRSPSPSSIPHSKKSSTDTTDSIEKLFSEFTDDMLVDVEFDSEDELVSITPRAVLKKIENYNNDQNVDETFNNLFNESKITANDIDNFNYLVKEASISSSLQNTENLNIVENINNVTEILDSLEVEASNNLGSTRTSSASVPSISLSLDEPAVIEITFPQKPPRKNKTVSSSVSPDTLNIVAKAKEVTKAAHDIPPSVQDIMENYHKEIIDKKNIVIIPVENPTPVKFPVQCVNVQSDNTPKYDKEIKYRNKIPVDIESVKEIPNSNNSNSSKNFDNIKNSPPEKKQIKNESKSHEDPLNKTDDETSVNEICSAVSNNEKVLQLQPEEVSLNKQNAKSLHTTEDMKNLRSINLSTFSEKNPLFEKIEKKLRGVISEHADDDNENWKIIDKLEKERLIALRKRDEVYAIQNQDSHYSTVTPASKLQKQISQESRTSQRTTSTNDLYESAQSKSSSDIESSQISLRNFETSSNFALDESTSDSNDIKSIIDEGNKAKLISGSEILEIKTKNATAGSLNKQKCLSSDTLDKKPTWPGLENEHSVDESISNKAKSLTPVSSELTDLEPPIRPHRKKSSNEPVDKGTQLLLERSQWLREKKRDFMDEKKGGNNPYIRRMIDSDRSYRDVRNINDVSDENEEFMDAYRPPPRMYFPNSTRSSSSGRRYNSSTYTPTISSTYTPSTYNSSNNSYIPSTSGYNSTNSYYYPTNTSYYSGGDDYHNSRVPSYSTRYTSPFSSSSTGYTNTSSGLGYSKRSPSHHKDHSRDSCRIS